jgi:hypothetical protein
MYPDGAERFRRLPARCHLFRAEGDGRDLVLPRRHGSTAPVVEPLTGTTGRRLRRLARHLRLRSLTASGPIVNFAAEAGGLRRHPSDRQARDRWPWSRWVVDGPAGKAGMDPPRLRRARRGATRAPQLVGGTGARETRYADRFLAGCFAAFHAGVSRFFDADRASPGRRRADAAHGAEGSDGGGAAVVRLA